MTFPSPKNWRLVVAKFNDDGEAEFSIGAEPQAIGEQPGVVEGVWYWRTDTPPTVDNPGAVATHMDLATPGGSTFGIVRFAANSAGKQEATSAPASAETGHGGDAAMHASATLDYEVVLSGKLDLELPNGRKHTVVPGDLLVLAGVPHAWKNPYDEDCVYLAVTTGLSK